MLISPRRVVLSRCDTRRTPRLLARRSYARSQHQREPPRCCPPRRRERGPAPRRRRGRRRAPRAPRSAPRRRARRRARSTASQRPRTTSGEHHRHGSPGQRAVRARAWSPAAECVRGGCRYRALPVAPRQRAVRGAEQERPPGERLAERPATRDRPRRGRRGAPGWGQEPRRPRRPGRARSCPAAARARARTRAGRRAGAANGIGAAAAQQEQAVPWRSASGETSQAQRPITASSQPMRGSTAVATAAIPAAASTENEGSGPRPSRHASTSPPAARPAAARSGSRPGGVLRRAAGRIERVRRRSAPREPAASRHARQPDPPQRRGLDQAALVGQLRFRGSQAGAQRGGSRAAGRIDVERLVHGVAELERQVAPQAGQRGQRPAEAARGGGRAARAHRIGPRPGLVEGQRERVDVAGGRHARALGLLGRHVGERARRRRRCA